jgi:hypothetical protein
MVMFLNTVNEIVHFLIGLCTVSSTDETEYDRCPDPGAHRNHDHDGSTRCRLRLSDFSVVSVSLTGFQRSWQLV